MALEPAEGGALGLGGRGGIGHREVAGRGQEAFEFLDAAEELGLNVGVLAVLLLAGGALATEGLHRLAELLIELERVEGLALGLANLGAQFGFAAFAGDELALEGAFALAGFGQGLFELGNARGGLAAGWGNGGA